MHTIVERIKSRDVLEHNGLKGEDTNPSRQKKQLRTQALQRFAIIRPALEEGVSQAQG